MLKSKLKTQEELQCIDHKQAFLSQTSETEALRYVAFPEKITLIHLFFTFVKIQENFK